jgi:hypothetical protein
VPQPDRNEIYDALVAIFSQLNPTTANPPGNGVLASPFADRFKLASQIQLQPWACLMATAEDISYQLYNGPSTRKLISQLVVYSRYGKDPNVAPIKALNNLMTQFEAIVRSGIKEQTLGGLASWVRFEGHTTVYTGDMLDQAITVANISILATI